MKNILIRNKYFFYPYLVLLAITVPVFFMPKADVHLFINRIHGSYADTFFKYITYLGDGMMPVFVGGILLLFSFRKAFIVAISGLLGGIIAQMLKRMVFSEIVRPSKYFEGITDLHLIEGVNLHSSFSFPSGHATTIFALCFCLAILSDKNVWKTLLFFTAVVVAFSRVYLSQHFLNDIYAGSIIGVSIALVVANMLLNGKAEWLDKSVFNMINISGKNE